MEQSILESTKKILGIAPDDESFDLDIVTHINNAFSNLHDLGVGPREGFAIEDDTLEWENFFELGENPVWMGKVKTLIYLRVRLVFDPPTTQYLLEALQKLIQEQEWKLNVDRESVMWTDPETGLNNLIVLRDPDIDVIDIDGGGAE
jgi:hypothetical protein